MQLLVKLAFVAAVGGVGFEDVTVSGFQLFQDTALVHHTGPAVIGETAHRIESLPYLEYGRRTFVGLCGAMRQ